MSCAPATLPSAGLAGAGRAVDDRPLRVAILTGGVSRQAGGVFEALVGLSRAMHAPPEMDLRVLGLRDAGTTADAEAWGTVPVAAMQPRGPRQFGFSPELGPALARLRPDIIHVHGLWMYPSVAALRWVPRTGAACVVSPHGMLDPWALRNSAWRKHFAGALYELRHLRRASCLHALGASEHAAIRAFGLRNPVCVIPNGITLPPSAAKSPAWRSELPPGAKVLLYLGRLHPKKGLANLIHGWGSARRFTPAAGSWRLVLAGWDQAGHRAELEALAMDAGVAGAVHFIGPQFGAEKDATFAAADAFVLPSLSEGLPVVVLEAWAHGVPTLMTPHCNLPEGYAAGAALRVEPDPESIAAGLRRLVLMTGAERSAMGAAGRDLVVERFAWHDIAARMASVYRWLRHRALRPDCVEVLAERPARHRRTQAREAGIAPTL